MTTKDELNGQTEKRTDKKDDTLSKAEKILDKYLNTNIMDEAIPSILEAMEDYHKSELKKKPNFCIRCNEVIRTGLEQN